jgi:hypothetical protein
MVLNIDSLNNRRRIQSVSGSVEHIFIEFGHEHQRMELLELSRCILLILKNPAEESIFIEGMEALSCFP